MTQNWLPAAVPMLNLLLSFYLATVVGGAAAKELVTINTQAEFTSILQDHTVDVFAFVSKEKCPHCTKAKPLVGRLVSAFADVADRLKIVLVNSSSKELPPRVWRTVFSELEGFPSLYLRAAQKPGGGPEEPVEFTQALHTPLLPTHHNPNSDLHWQSRRLDEVVTWICGHTTNPLQHSKACAGIAQRKDEM
jgi:hypothetical protein